MSTYLCLWFTPRLLMLFVYAQVPVCSSRMAKLDILSFCHCSRCVHALRHTYQRRTCMHDSQTCGTGMLSCTTWQAGYMLLSSSQEFPMMKRDVQHVVLAVDRHVNGQIMLTASTASVTTAMQLLMVCCMSVQCMWQYVAYYKAYVYTLVLYTCVCSTWWCIIAWRQLLSMWPSLLMVLRFHLYR